MKVRADALVVMLNFALAPSPLYCRPSISRRCSYRISDTDQDHANRHNEMLIYDLMDSEVTMISDGWEKILQEYKSKGDLYSKLIEEMPEFAARVPHELWFPAKVLKQLLLPPFDDAKPNGLLDQAAIDWARSFAT